VNTRLEEGREANLMFSWLGQNGLDNYIYCILESKHYGINHLSGGPVVRD
jgi:hypothetical protein